MTAVPRYAYVHDKCQTCKQDISGTGRSIEFYSWRGNPLSSLEESKRYYRSDTWFHRLEDRFFGSGFWNLLLDPEYPLRGVNKAGIIIGAASMVYILYILGLLK